MLHSILKKYLPSLGKSWLFVIVFLAGTLLISFALAAAPEGSFFRSTCCMYLCSFLPLFIFIFFDAKSNAKPHSKEVSINHAIYGNLSPFIFYPAIALAVICLEIAIEPISALIPMPDAIKTLFENMARRPMSMQSAMQGRFLAISTETEWRTWHSQSMPRI